MIFFNKKKKISPGVTVIPPHCSTTVVTSRQNSKDCNYIIYIKSIIMYNLFYYYYYYYKKYVKMKEIEQHLPGY